MELQNVSAQKLDIVGICTRYPQPSFVDLSQPGAFHLTLYPGQTATLIPDNDQDEPHGRPPSFHIWVQDFALSN
jgi:hypothetical protein